MNKQSHPYHFQRKKSLISLVLGSLGLLVVILSWVFHSLLLELMIQIPKLFSVYFGLFILFSIGGLIFGFLGIKEIHKRLAVLGITLSFISLVSLLITSFIFFIELGLILGP